MLIFLLVCLSFHHDCQFHLSSEAWYIIEGSLYLSATISQNLLTLAKNITIAYVANGITWRQSLDYPHHPDQFDQCHYTIHNAAKSMAGMFGEM